MHSLVKVAQLDLAQYSGSVLYMWCTHSQILALNECIVPLLAGVDCKT